MQAKSLDYGALITTNKQAKPLAASISGEWLAELSFQRSVMSTWFANTADLSSSSGVSQTVVDGLASFGSRLHGLANAVVELPGLKTEWSSPLSNKPSRLCRIEALSQELGMVYATQAAALRQLALQRLQALVGASGGSSGGAPPGEASPGGESAGAAPGGFPGAVGLLRQAAGLYAYLASDLLPSAAGGTASLAEKPVELHALTAACMSQLCLGEAQAAMAAAAAAKGNAPGTLAALHAGCSSLFSAAQKLCGEALGSGVPLGDRLSRYLALCVHAHAARAYVCMALDNQAKLELGLAEACCAESSRLLGLALRDIDRSDTAWVAWVKAEQAALSAILVPIQKDRLSVTYQPLPKQPPDAAAAAKVLASPTPFVALPEEPRAPPPKASQQQQQGGCSVM